MKVKHLISVALIFAFITIPALAADPVSHPASKEAPGPIMVWGKVKELGKERIRLSNTNDKDPYRDIVLNLSPNTVILEPVNGEQRSLSDIQENETLYAYVSPVMTKSLPPQSVPFMILCDIPADFAVPTYSEVQKVTRNEDGSISVLTSNNVVLSMDSKTTLCPYRTKNIVTLNNINPGVRILSWYSVVQTSEPAKATPSKVMVFPSQYSGWISLNPDSYSVNGKKLTASSYTEDGTVMLPMRAVAEALGCEVKWLPQTPDKASVLYNGKVLYTLTLGSSSIAVGENDASTLLHSSALKNGVTFVEANDLIRLHNLKLEAN